MNEIVILEIIVNLDISKEKIKEKINVISTSKIKKIKKNELKMVIRQSFYVQTHIRREKNFLGL